VNGSGTAALESAVMASVESNKKLLVINNGVYGSRIAQLARIHQIPLIEIRSPVTDRPDVTRIAAALKREGSIGTVAMVHHETSTGMLNPVEEVGALTKKYRRRFLVDGISSLGAEQLDLPKFNIGLCVGSAGKCLQGPPGLSFVLLAQEEVSRIVKLRPRSLYLDLGIHLKSQEAGDPPFTPAIPLFFAFHAALDELLREKLKGRIMKYRQRALLLRSYFKKMKLEFLLDEKLLSNTLTSMWVPKRLTYLQLHDALKKAGFVVYAGQSELKGKIFRVAHMGQLLQADLVIFLRTLKGIVTSAASAP
jgi:2-aminoethylphosphonate-pyruvate transaminase